MTYAPDVEIFKKKKENTEEILNSLKKGSTWNTPTKSVKESSAHYATQCSGGLQQHIANTIHYLLSDNNTDLNLYEKAIIELMFLHGLRITEALNITYRDINSNLQIKIRGLKGSSDRYVQSINFIKFWQYVRESKIVFVKSFNRYYFYRLFRKKGISFYLGNNKKESVTHLLRYNYVLLLLTDNVEVDVIQSVLGHKKLSSTLHYINNLQNEKKT